MKTFLLALFCCTSVLAQRPLVELSLAQDHERRGPAAWTYVRERILTRIPEWPDDLNPFAAIHLEISSTLAIEVRAGEAPQRYLTADVCLPSKTEITATCDFDGLESWQVREGDSLEPRLDLILTLLDLKFARSLLNLDLGALTGNLMAGSISGDPMHSLLTDGAVECGELQVGAFYESGRWRISGHSAGGLLLPATLALLAEWQRYPPNENDLFAARPSREIDRWLLLASAARGQMREEAVRQLARFGDEHAQRRLAQLLHSEGAVRQAAVVSLARLDQAAAIPPEDMTQLSSNAWARPGAWTLLALSLLAIGTRLFNSRQS